jgi:hypothetical protein
VEVLCVNHRPGPTFIEADGPVAVRRFARSVRVDKLDICRGLSSALARVEVDVLHLHAPNPTMILAILAAKPRLPNVVTY